MEDPINKYSGVRLSEHLSRIANDLENDGTCLGDVIASAQDSYGLEGEALKEYVTKAIMALLNKGARPAFPSLKGWEEQFQYGTNSEDIIENILKEWDTHLLGDPDKNGLWFALCKQA